MMERVFFGFAAGGLSILSPCVLPMAPVIMASAIQSHRLGPVALTGGLVFSFVATGTVVAAFGMSVGMDHETLRLVGGLLLIAAGVTLLTPPVQNRLALALSPITGRAAAVGARFESEGLMGQACIGLLVGVVWSPCAGPTLGSAIGMAVGSGSMPLAASIMTAFGVGAALPLLLIGYSSATLLKKKRALAFIIEKWGKRIMGGAILLLGALIVTHGDKTLEAAVTLSLPEWIIRLTTQY